MAIDQATANLIARLNTIPVSVDDLLKTSDEIHKLPQNERDWEGRAICAARLFKEQGEKAFAVTTRLEALAKLLRSGELPETLVPRAPDGSRVIAESVFMAAAKEPILFTSKEAFFNPQSFLASVLRFSEITGRG